VPFEQNRLLLFPARMRGGRLWAHGPDGPEDEVAVRLFFAESRVVLAAVVFAVDADGVEGEAVGGGAINEGLGRLKGSILKSPSRASERIRKDARAVAVGEELEDCACAALLGDEPRPDGHRTRHRGKQVASEHLWVTQRRRRIVLQHLHPHEKWIARLHCRSTGAAASSWRGREYRATSPATRSGGAKSVRSADGGVRMTYIQTESSCSPASGLGQRRRRIENRGHPCDIGRAING